MEETIADGRNNCKWKNRWKKQLQMERQTEETIATEKIDERNNCKWKSAN